MTVTDSSNCKIEFSKVGKDIAISYVSAAGIAIESFSVPKKELAKAFSQWSLRYLDTPPAFLGDEGVLCFVKGSKDNYYLKFNDVETGEFNLPSLRVKLKYNNLI